MKACAMMLCAATTIWAATSLAQTKVPSMQAGTTILTLNKMCQDKPGTLQYALCLGYLRGLFDGMQQAKIVENTKNTFCPPATPDLDQMKGGYRSMDSRQSQADRRVLRMGGTASSLPRISM